MQYSPNIVGVGLRHEHYYDAINHPANIDFVEVHAENLFMQGGIVKDLIHSAKKHYDLSIHATSLGLGSITAPCDSAVDTLKGLVSEFDPLLVSDHACFNRALVHGKQIHTGDLLPLRYNRMSLDILSRHVDQVQLALGRPILIENLSAYIAPSSEDMPEFAFLAELSKKTGCKLLLDLNNILVNQHNNAVFKSRALTKPDVSKAIQSLQPISSEMIGEIHLAGTTPVGPGELMVDDHARTVSDSCWLFYRDVIQTYGPAPTLIEWDQDLPDWTNLVELALKAKAIQDEICQ